MGLLAVPRVVGWWRERASQPKSDSAQALATARLNFCVAVIGLVAGITGIASILAPVFTGDQHRRVARGACAPKMQLGQTPHHVRHGAGARRRN
jgi:hypothetical protein